MTSSLRARLLVPKNPIIPVASPELTVPIHFRCPISLELMKDPVTAPTGITYDRHSIETWLDTGNATCPVTNQPIHHDHLVPNHTLRRMIQDWCVTHQSHGVDRIPTPRIPATRLDVEALLSEIDSEARRANHVGCARLVGKVKAIAKESERSRRRVSSSGASPVLTRAFDAFARAERDARTCQILEEILSALVLFFPMEPEAYFEMISPESVGSLAWILKNGNLAGRLDAVMTVKELVRHVNIIGSGLDPITESNGLVEALARLVKEPISAQTTKAALVSIFHLVSSNPNVASRFAETGLVALVIELLVDNDRSTSEKALGVLDGMCGSELGREAALDHDLTVAVVVKKLLRVSDLATEFAVSVLWKMCRSGEGRRCLEEALRVGVFQKLLVVLQIGCGAKTKEKVKELLKMLNTMRERLECVETIDFKGLKRPF